MLEYILKYTNIVVKSKYLKNFNCIDQHSDRKCIRKVIETDSLGSFVYERGGHWITMNNLFSSEYIADMNFESTIEEPVFTCLVRPGDLNK